MKTWSWIVPFCTGLFGVAAGAVFFTSSSHSGQEEVSGRVSSLEEVQKKQIQRLESLQKSVEGMQISLGLLESAVAPHGNAAKSVTALETPSLGLSATEAQASLTSQRTPVTTQAPSDGNVPMTPQFRSMVRTVMDEQKAEEEAKAKLQAEQRRIDRVNRRVDRAATDLQLSSFQKEDLKKVLLKEEETRAQLFEKFRDPEGVTDQEAMALAWRELRTTRDEDLARVLTPEQLEKFQSSDRNRFGFGGQGGGFGGFGGPGGGNTKGGGFQQKGQQKSQEKGN